MSDWVKDASSLCQGKVLEVHIPGNEKKEGISLVPPPVIKTLPSSSKIVPCKELDDRSSHMLKWEPTCLGQ